MQKTSSLVLTIHILYLFKNQLVVSSEYHHQVKTGQFFETIKVFSTKIISVSSMLWLRVSEEHCLFYVLFFFFLSSRALPPGSLYLIQVKMTEHLASVSSIWWLISADNGWSQIDLQPFTECTFANTVWHVMLRAARPNPQSTKLLWPLLSEYMVANYLYIFSQLFKEKIIVTFNLPVWCYCVFQLVHYQTLYITIITL